MPDAVSSAPPGTRCSAKTRSGPVVRRWIVRSAAFGRAAKRVMSSRLSTTTAAASKGSRAPSSKHDLNVPCVQRVLVEPKPHRLVEADGQRSEGVADVGSVGLAHRLERLEQAFVGDQRVIAFWPGTTSRSTGPTQSRRSPPERGARRSRPPGCPRMMTAAEPRCDSTPAIVQSLQYDGASSCRSSRPRHSSYRRPTEARRAGSGSSIRLPPSSPMARSPHSQVGRAPPRSTRPQSGPSRPHASTRPGRRPTLRVAARAAQRGTGRPGRAPAAPPGTRRAAETRTVVNLTAN